jgi:hypothetical protein
LNRIRRQGTHRLIRPVGSASGGGVVRDVTIASPHFLSLPTLIWNSEKDEVVFAITNPGSDLNYNIDLTLFITFGEV